MKRRIEFLLKSLILIGVTCVCVILTNDVLVPKYTDDTNFPTSATYKGFYEMERDSIDVIFLGSSRASCAFSPQELYNVYGIRSYNLGCEMQNVLVSYYWLKEALRFQNPKVVVLETGMIFPYRTDEPLNTSIECTRKALDYMKWSSVKVQAVSDICNYDKTQSWESYAFPNIQYHDRWEELSKNDFMQNELYGNLKLKGQTVLCNFYHDWENKGLFESSESRDKEKMHDVMETYLNKLVSLCEEKNIELVLVSAPCAFDSVEKYNALQEYSKNNNLLFIDYNEKSQYDQVGYDYVTDNAEYHHVGINGAKKLTAHLGNVFQSEFGIINEKDEQWEVSQSYYEQINKENNLREVYRIEEYLEKLDNVNYTVFIVAQNVYGLEEIPLNIKNSMKKLGMTDNFWQKDSGNRYYAIINENSVVEKNHHEPIGINGTLLKGGVQYSLTSDVYESSIKIDNIEYSKCMEGLNIVVYSNSSKRVVDSSVMVFENDESYLVR